MLLVIDVFPLIDLKPKIKFVLKRKQILSFFTSTDVTNNGICADSNFVLMVS